jgi:dihydroneopterin aldolase
MEVSKFMDTVFIRDLCIDAVIGVFGWERQVHQKITINLEMATDISQAAKTDDLAHTLDYKAISQRIRAIVEENQPQLVETLIELIAKTIMSEFNIPWLRISIAKPGAVRGSAAVGVTIERGSRG